VAFVLCALHDPPPGALAHVPDMDRPEADTEPL
jgi:hypothetical protein